METITTPTIEAPATPKAAKPAVKPAVRPAPDFGNSRYSAAMRELFSDAIRVLGLTAEQAERLAKAFGNDYGRAMASAPIETRVTGKINNGGQITLREMAKVKVITTNALIIARLIVALDEARMFGLTHESTYILAPRLVEWLDNTSAR